MIFIWVKPAACFTIHTSTGSAVEHCDIRLGRVLNLGSVSSAFTVLSTTELESPMLAARILRETHPLTYNLV